MKSFISGSDTSWSLFLDRDGVINRRIHNDYVKNFDEFEFLPGNLNAIATFNKLFSTIVVVTNQQGIGKGLMTTAQLDEIHKQMMLEVENNKGRIDKVYFCPDLKGSGSFFRKPAIGMGLKAKKDFKNINFKKSIMVGDSLSDMIFGKRLGMKTVYIKDDFSKEQLYPKLIDFAFVSLLEFSETLEKYNL